MVNNLVNIEQPDIRILFKRYFSKSTDFKLNTPPETLRDITPAETGVRGLYERSNTEYYNNIVVPTKLQNIVLNAIDTLYSQKNQTTASTVRGISEVHGTDLVLQAALDNIIQSVKGKILEGWYCIEKGSPATVPGTVKIETLGQTLVAYTELKCTWAMISSLFRTPKATLSKDQIDSKIEGIGAVSGKTTKEGCITHIPAFDIRTEYGYGKNYWLGQLDDPADPDDYDVAYWNQNVANRTFVRASFDGFFRSLQNLLVACSYLCIQVEPPVDYELSFQDIFSLLNFYQGERIWKDGSIQYNPSDFRAFSSYLTAFEARLKAKIAPLLYTKSSAQLSTYLAALDEYVSNLPQGSYQPLTIASQTTYSQVLDSKIADLSSIAVELMKGYAPPPAASTITVAPITPPKKSEALKWTQKVMKTVYTGIFSNWGKAYSALSPAMKTKFWNVVGSFVWGGTLYPTLEEQIAAPNPNSVLQSYQGLGLSGTEMKSFVFDHSRISDKGFSYFMPNDLFFGHYELGTLEVAKGLKSVQSTISRIQSGSASAKFVVPIIDNNIEGDILQWYPAPGSSGGGIPTWALAGNAPGQLMKQGLLDILVTRREALFQPMDKIQIWMKVSPFHWSRSQYSDWRKAERDKYESYNLLQAYKPVFTGLLTEVTVDYGQGAIEVGVRAEDTTKWLKVTRVNVSPSLTYNPEKSDVTTWSSVFHGMTGAQIIKTLLLGNLNSTSSTVKIFGIDDMVLADKSEYANGTNRFVVGDRIRYETDFDKTLVYIQENQLADWTPYPAIFQNIPLWQTQYQTRYNIINDIVATTEFEFYADGAGVLTYKPPYYTMNPDLEKPIGYIQQDGKVTSTIPNELPTGSELFGYPVGDQVIENAEIISESSAFSDSSLVTIMTVTGTANFNLEQVAQTSATWVWNPKLLARYGSKVLSKAIPLFDATQTAQAQVPAINGQVSPILSDTERARKYMGYALMNRRNMEAKTCSVTIVGRPEISLGKTICLIDSYNDLSQQLGDIQNPSIPIQSVLKNIQVWYVTSISHSYSAGGICSTTLVLTHGRYWWPITPDMSVGFNMPYEADFTKKIFDSVKAVSSGDRSKQSAEGSGEVWSESFSPTLSQAMGKVIASNKASYSKAQMYQDLCMTAREKIIPVNPDVYVVWTGRGWMGDPLLGAGTPPQSGTSEYLLEFQQARTAWQALRSGFGRALVNETWEPMRTIVEELSAKAGGVWRQ